MTRKSAWFPFLAAPLLGGCLATQQDVAAVGSQLEGLQTEMVRYRQTLDGMQKNQADLALRINAVQKDLGQFNENFTGFRDQVKSLRTKLDDLDAALEKRMKAVTKAVASVPPPPPPGPTPSDLFKEAEGHLARKRYEAAVAGFQLYLKESPKGALADQAHFLTGEAYLDDGKPREAARAYAQVLDAFPKSGLTPAARLRYAAALLQLTPPKAEEASRYLESILEDFPQSPEARRAELRLKELASAPTAPQPTP